MLRLPKVVKLPYPATGTKISKATTVAQTHRATIHVPASQEKTTTATQAAMINAESATKREINGLPAQSALKDLLLLPKPLSLLLPVAFATPGSAGAV